MTDVDILREYLIKLLDSELAHVTLTDATADFPPDLINTRPPNVPYTFWQLIEHLRLTQWDVLDYMRNPNYTYIEWPKDYWPAPTATADWAGWERSIVQFESDLAEIKAIINDPATNLYSQIPHGEPGHNILREVLVIADHNSYHIGELGILRQVMNAWPPGHE